MSPEIVSITNQAAFQGRVLLGVIAHFYDWGYAQLTPKQRQDIVEWLNTTTHFEHIECHEGRLYMRNDGASVAQGIAAAAFATAGENPQGGQLMARFRERWDQTLKAFNIIGKGGATGEGNAYGTSPTSSGIITAANIAYTAAGEDLFTSHLYFRQQLLYDAFAIYPDTIGGPKAVVTFPDHPFAEEDDGRAVSVVSDITKAYNNPRYSTAGNSPKVNRVYRRLVHIRALDMLAIADTVESTQPQCDRSALIVKGEDGTKGAT